MRQPEKTMDRSVIMGGDSGGCVDLWRTFGDTYKIITDPAYNPSGINHSRLDPWYFVIPCKYGFISPHGRKVLEIYMDRHDYVAKKVAALRGVVLYADGDRDKAYLFHVSRFNAVAAIVKPKRRRKMSEENRMSAAVRLGDFRFGA